MSCTEKRRFEFELTCLVQPTIGASVSGIISSASLQAANALCQCARCACSAASCTSAETRAESCSRRFRTRAPLARAPARNALAASAVRPSATSDAPRFTYATVEKCLLNLLKSVLSRNENCFYFNQERKLYYTVRKVKNPGQHESDSRIFTCRPNSSRLSNQNYIKCYKILLEK